MLPELKPCPLCGSLIVTTGVKGGENKASVYFVQCMGCTANVFSHESKEDAIRKWNTRLGPLPNYQELWVDIFTLEPGTNFQIPHNGVDVCRLLEVLPDRVRYQRMGYDGHAFTKDHIKVVPVFIMETWAA